MEILTKSNLAKDLPQRKFKAGTKLSEHMREQSIGGQTVWEFIQPEDFGAAWGTRQRYEIDAGRDSEPILYTPLYNVMEDEDFPAAVQINLLGPGGVFFSELLPGGETKFASIGQDSQLIPIKDYTVGLEYSERMVVYNQMWDVAIFERQAGIASNALLNHLHFFPILNHAYTAANQTASVPGSTLAEGYLRTLEDAATNSRTDGTNPRRGPYYLLVSSANFYTAERALRGGEVIGVDMNSTVRGDIRGIIAYDGWTGNMSGLSVNYPGVTAGKAYLVDVNESLKMKYARSLIKFIMRMRQGNEDVSRLIAQQVVLWSALGLYYSPAALVEEITWPTTTV